MVYKQEATCHAKWITTASTYLRLLICDICHLDDCRKSNFIRLIWCIISVYVPSFLLIHLKPSAGEGPRITLFQHDFLLANREIDSELAGILKFFYEHAVQWMSPVTVALCVFAEVSPYSIEAVKTSHHPGSVDARKLLQGRKAGPTDFLQVRAEPLLASYALRYQYHIAKVTKITTELLKG